MMSRDPQHAQIDRTILGLLMLGCMFVAGVISGALIMQWLCE